MLCFCALANCLTKTPSQSCWPSTNEWKKLNGSVDGQLILDTPVAISCYPGPAQNPTQCAVVNQNWSKNTFQQEFPVGYSYPLNITCPPVDASAGQTPGTCTLGNNPVYTVNATRVEHVAAGIRFAKKNNLRLVIRDTGHDLLGRSTGADSLQIWIRYLRTGVTFHEQFAQSGSSWNGSAFTIGGGYTWADVYPLAAERGVIVVGGGTPSVGCLGGWMQGGGHSPATHDYGLGADQVLQAKVVLADGSLVTASPTKNPDLFFAIRGGGPGTYGVVVETTIKAWPTKPVVAQVLTFSPLNPGDRTNFLDAVAELYSLLPNVTQAGWSGYGSWSIANAAGPTISYAHSLANFQKSLDDAQSSFAPVLARLQRYNGSSLAISISYAQLPNYAQYYQTYSGTDQPAGTFSALGSRFLDTATLQANATALRQTLDIIAGASDEYTVNVVEIFGAPSGQIARDGRTAPVSGVNPAWREMIMHQIVARGWTADTPVTYIQSVQRDITYVKSAALKRLAPNTGCYMNEADRLDPDYIADFYGKVNYKALVEVKAKYDPTSLFYCPTCVGSEKWEVREDQKLCRL